MAKEKNEKKANSDKGEIKETNLKKCFFITPIGEKDSNEYKKLQAIVSNVLNKVLKNHGYGLIVANDIHAIGSIGDQVFTNIIEADLVISNLSGWNANVMYETAVAHSFSIPTIMICERGTQLPFDLINDRTIFFEDTIEGTGMLIDELDKKIPEFQKDVKIDNPVIRVIERKALAENIEGKTDDNSQIMRLLLDINDRLDIHENYFKDNNAMLKNRNEKRISYPEKVRCRVSYINTDNIDVYVELKDYLISNYRGAVKIIPPIMKDAYGRESVEIIIREPVLSPSKILKNIESFLLSYGMTEIKL
ncbi:TPA: hypothetical protein ACOW36_001705 [Enterococcus faecalis]|uniref:hypothetical protein n=1 Tax=Enterococcus faecalis TaxID=1351 RepID=UPI003B86676D